MTDQGTTRPFLVVRGQDVTGEKRPTTYLESLANGVKAYLGTGIFALGYAFMSSGLALGPILMVLFAGLNLHCQHILVKAVIQIIEKETVDVQPTFGETVEYTFQDSSSFWLQKKSHTFGILTDAFLLIAEYGFCIVYLIFISTHLQEIAAAHDWNQDYRTVLAIILIPMWISTFLGNFHLLAPLCIIANFIMWAGIALILYYAVQDLPPISDRYLVASVMKLPIFFGITLFSFEGITFIIPLRAEMKNPKKLTTPFGILNMAMLICVILYLLVGIFSFWKWGTEVSGSVFLNMPQQEALSQVTKIFICIGVMLSYVVHMYIPFEILYPRFYRKYGPFNHPTAIINVYRSVAVLITYALANISSKVATCISLVGALTGSVLALLLPVMLELVMLYGKLTAFIITKDVLIILIAIAGAITGTTLSINDIIKEYSPEENKT